MNFSQAWDRALSGSRITRSGWPFSGAWLEVQWPDDKSKMTLPYLYITYADGSRQPWVATQADFFATDWKIAP